ncbi:hypothetical protein [Gordonia sp. (in: high G+C Gram-positive bacteria)]|uniref:hypothetical protein n=1 Tax=Gordonia sp. (in: high G+C Gram-positive bacteria) TaxID=84139 RepID=UPI003C725840
MTDISDRLIEYGASIDTLEGGPTISVRSLVDAWSDLRGVTLSLIVRGPFVPGPARLSLDQVEDLIGALSAARDHVTATTIDADASPDTRLKPKFRDALPPKEPTSQLALFGSELAAAPGMWALHPSSPYASPVSASATVSHINRGRSKAFPTNLFEAQARGTDVYVRYQPKGRR